MDILYLVDRLENLISSSRKMPLVNQVILKESDILNIVDQMRTAIPEEVKQARRIIQDKERIFAQAQADATALLTRARQETERAMNREGLLRAAEDRSKELVREAEERSKELVRQAEEHSEQLKNDADDYVAETLRALHDHLSNIQMDLSHTMASIEKGLESLDVPVEENEENAEEAYEEYEEGEDGDPVNFLQPRSSSLAADTIGGPAYDQNGTPWAGDAKGQVRNPVP